MPEFSLVEMDRYSAMNIPYSRGGAFNCEFCDIIEIYGHVPRTKSNSQMLAELDALKATGWRGLVFIVDDNFIGNKKNVRLFMPDLIEWSRANGDPFSYITEASVNLAEDDALLAQMEEAGFRRVFLGIEAPVEESLKEAQKGQNTRRDLLDSIHKIQSYGMEVMAGFIVGFDSDPDDIFDRQMQFIRESGIPLAMVRLLTALPDLDARELGNLPAHVRKLVVRLLPRFPADRSVAKLEQVPDLLEAESQPLGRLDEPKPGENRRVVVVDAAQRFGRLRQQPLALVEADGLDVDPGALSQQAHGDGWRRGFMALDSVLRYGLKFAP